MGTHQSYERHCFLPTSVREVRRLVCWALGACPWCLVRDMAMIMNGGANMRSFFYDMTSSEPLAVLSVC